VDERDKQEVAHILRAVTRAAVLLLACLVTATAGAAGPSVVRVDGRIGPFRIDHTSEANLRARLGKPARVEKTVPEFPGAPAGRTLDYSCGRGCQTSYSFNAATGKLSDFWSASPTFVTERGSHVGMKAAEAARRERARPVPGCGDGLYIHVHWDAHHIFVLTVSRGRVDGLLYLGPHSIFYEGLC
jgi:hypothetical protein